MKEKKQSPLLFVMCSLLAVGGVLDPSPFRWVILSIAGLLGIILAVRSIQGHRVEQVRRLPQFMNEERLVRAMEYMNAVKISDYGKMPLIHRFAWKVGMRVPPPMLASFLFNVVFLGTVFAVLFSICMIFLFVVVYGKSSLSVVLMLLGASASSGLFFGMGMALYFRSLAVRYKIPKWESLTAGSK